MTQRKTPEQFKAGAEARRAARFWASVAKSDGCWEWQGELNANGYGRFWPGGSGRVLVHRFVWSQAHGAIQGGMHVCHRCDNKRCVRLEHLFLGSRSDNMRDMQSKGRGRGQFQVGWSV